MGRKALIFALLVLASLLLGSIAYADAPAAALDASLSAQHPAPPAQRGYLDQATAESAACTVATPCSPLTVTNEVLAVAQPAVAAALVPAAATANNGFILAYAVMALLIGSLIYAVVAAFRAQSAEELTAGPVWFGRAIPVLVVVGMGVAGYLAFVETQNVAAVCGPVGDCNAVQTSSYAKLFGVLPIGILGLIGYVGIIVAWLVARGRPGTQLAGFAHLALFGMALFGVLFTIYLTYLELAVIHAVCIWCLTNAVIITLIMIFSVPPAMAAWQEAGLEPDEA